MENSFHHQHSVQNSLVKNIIFFVIRARERNENVQNLQDLFGSMTFDLLIKDNKNTSFICEDIFAPTCTF